jgi:uracil-DNA glycosylase family 4
MSLKSVSQKIIKCERCPRLRLYCQGIAKKKKKEFSDFTYWGKPVPGFGDPKGNLWIIGLAPGAHGANRTGRMFTGDSSGDWLYGALYKHGFASQSLSKDSQDGMKLKGVFISAAARCAPPDNKPTLKELKNCEPFLDEEYALLVNKQVFLALGKIAFESILKLLKRNHIEIPTPKPKFQHGAIYHLGAFTVFVSYHPSRQNTNTGVLTPQMWDTIFSRAKSLTGELKHPE